MLEHIASLSTDADEATFGSGRFFLPIPQHRLALRPDIVVIQGTRGAGKTALFNLVNQLGDGVSAFFADPSIPSAQWIEGFSENSAAHPSTASLDSFVASVALAQDVKLRAFWIVHLLARLVAANVPAALMPPEVQAARDANPGDISGWIDVAVQRIGSLTSALDAVDTSLGESGYVFVTYDHLDRLGLMEANGSTRQRLVRGLTALWLSNSTRYRRLRGKIFLRSDLFEEVGKSFPDASKLRPRSVSLDWNVESLYRLVARRLANYGPHQANCRAWLREAGIELTQHPSGCQYGLVPGEMSDEAGGVQDRFATAFAGRMVGGGARKGFTYRWIPARLRDSHQRIVPRSFLRLFGYAAKLPHANPSAEAALVEFKNLDNALIQTSKDRSTELQEEYKFVARLDQLRGVTLLLERSDVARLLSPERDDGFGENGDAVVDELIRIGVLSSHDDGRIDMPDIYRCGYDIKRRGGPKRASMSNAFPWYAA